MKHSSIILLIYAAAATLLLSACNQSNQPEQASSAEVATKASDKASPDAEIDEKQISTSTVDAAIPSGLPAMQQCKVTSKPTLPSKWTASALMQAFGEYDVVLGKFTYDESEQAYRFSLSRAGASTFTDYLLTADHRLYALSGPYDQPTSCRYSLMLGMDLPSRNLMSAAAQCVGEAPILGKNRQWWKDASSVTPGANWYWFDTDSNRSLFRMMPYGQIDNAGWPGGYAFTYYSDFTAQSSTNIGSLKRLCGINTANDAALPQDTLVSFADALQDLLPAQPDAGEPAQVAAPFYPGVEQCQSPTQRPPQWPNTVEATTFLTAVNVKYSPFPSLVRYNARAQGLRTDMYNPWPTQNKKWDLYSARLYGNTGYSSYFYNGVYQSCNQDLPGPPVPNWMQVDNCECKAKLSAGSALNPGAEDSLVMMCPLTPSSSAPQSPQVFWTWYGERSGSPVVFMQTNSSASAGTGLNLADYYSWAPGTPVDPGIFVSPPGCAGQPKEPVPIQCHNCHLPTNNEFKSEGPVRAHIPIE